MSDLPRHIVIDRELLSQLVQDAVKLDRPCEPMSVPHVEAATRLLHAGAYLVCDQCGAVHADDAASCSESCKCGRMKKMMSWVQAWYSRYRYSVRLPEPPPPPPWHIR